MHLCRVKALLCLTPVLAVLQLDQLFKLHIDGSNVDAGVVLLQENVEEGVDCPVNFPLSCAPVDS